MLKSLSSTFWLVAGFAVVIGQTARMVWQSQGLINRALAFDIALPQLLIYVLTVGFLVGMIWLFYSKHRLGRWWAVGLGLVVGGGISNLLDRIMLGGVSDYWRLAGLSTINLPDVMITIGIALAIYLITVSHES